MTKMTKIVGLALVAGMVALSAMAIPLPPLTSVPVAGQSDLTSFIVSSGSDGGLITVDWMVIDAGTLNSQFTGMYAYLYQVENPENNPTHVDALNITFNTLGVVSAGVLAGDDLDVATGSHSAHDVGTYANLAGEAEGFNFVSLSSVLTSIDLDGITWTFDGLDAGDESDTLFFVHPLPPTYGNAVAQNSTPPSPWGSLADDGQQVPIPGRESVPDFGSTMLLLGMAISAMGIVGRKLDKKRA